MVARRLGAGDRTGALTGGLDGLVLAVLLGVVLCVVLQLIMPALLGIYRADPEVTAAATAYLRVAALGLPSVLLLLASTGVLRGLHDTRTPLYVVIATNLINIALNVILVYGAGLGIAGSAIGTLIAQTGAAVVLAIVVVRGARRDQARLRFRPRGILLRGPDRDLAGRPDRGAADGLHDHHHGRGHRRRGRPGRAPGGRLAVDPAGLRPGRDRDRRRRRSSAATSAPARWSAAGRR